MNDVRFAFDRASVRRYDADGMLHVELTPISKSNVCVYYGREIPDWEELGLQPDKAYRLYRDPEELKKAAATFNNKPLLDTHIAVDVTNPPKESIIGATGSNAVFEGDYLKNSLVLWDVNSIIGVENEQQREISSSYRYRLDMTPGEFDGETYDGVMRDIVCNHVAIVPSGRAGPDVFVYDSLPTGLKLMSKINKLMALFKPHLANDADPKEMEKKVEEIIKDEEDQKGKDVAKDSEDDDKKIAKDEDGEEKDKKTGTADDDDDDGEPEKKKESGVAMDAMRRELREEFASLRRAEREVEPYVGRLACDSADEVYRTALKQMGCEEHKTIPASALSSVFKAYSRAPSMAQDSAPITHSSRKAVSDFFEGK